MIGIREELGTFIKYYKNQQLIHTQKYCELVGFFCIF